MGSDWIKVWIITPDWNRTYYACSNCGYDRAEAEYEYCPHCGKKMKQPETEIAEKRFGDYMVRLCKNRVTFVYDPEKVKE